MQPPTCIVGVASKTWSCLLACAAPTAAMTPAGVAPYTTTSTLKSAALSCEEIDNNNNNLKIRNGSMT
eukprot:m.305282 g.305282  ORF g.305282 m.305282 type:complete len:68 (-) comp16447_c0_seq1:57-260(-)